VFKGNGCVAEDKDDKNGRFEHKDSSKGDRFLYRCELSREAGRPIKIIVLVISLVQSCRLFF
jgi:hypothetical protein